VLGFCNVPAVFTVAAMAAPPDDGLLLVVAA
jgi:hypothetical protein